VIGSEAVTWLMQRLKFKHRSQAVRIGEALQRRGVFDHVLKKHQFEDGNFYFRFAKANRPSIKQLTKLVQEKPAGFDVQDRKYRLKTYKKCFIGPSVFSLCGARFCSLCSYLLV